MTQGEATIAEHLKHDSTSPVKGIRACDLHWIIHRESKASTSALNRDELEMICRGCYVVPICKGLARDEPFKLETNLRMVLDIFLVRGKVDCKDTC